MQSHLLHKEDELLFDNEVKVNLYISKVLFHLAIIVIPLIIILQVVGVFIYYMTDAIGDIVTAFILLIMPRLLTLVQAHEKKWFKYILIVLVIMTLPLIYLEYDYMVLILWIFPLLISSMYFSNRFNVITVIMNVIVLGFTSYYRSYLRLQNNLISERIGGLFNDFIISYITYAILVILSFAILFILTNKTNGLLREMVKKKQYEILSITDSMTGLYNHRFLMKELEDKKLIFDRDNTPFCTILFDVDHFKHINDTFGHVEGDEVLKAIAKCLQNNIRSEDILGRYGGEEFMVIFPKTKLHDACHIAERCRENVAKIVIDEVTMSLTISGGVDEYTGDSILEYIRCIDEKMYKAKENGRNKIIA
ncbi:GGDEF domain-containing protein [Vallitalea pronyensis]|uniref:GGDEF domain-containing protein n=1 Tax=Vallitalea pronyensis TaxID=1348613 RepID=A0A8J8MLM0_9FIRM|nr:GGDEF domain-containing protein [Vallitalea pronyensis]QUI23784.1 GGDEF domain-containing protein [Vallitalea pronyensis]